MTDLSRRFEFDCSPFGKGHLYIADLDVRDRNDYVEIKYSPRNFASRTYSADRVFWVDTEPDLASYFKNGTRRITEVYDQGYFTFPNVEDLI